MPVADRFKTRVCRLSLAGIAGSNAAGGIYICPRDCCMVEVSAMGRSLVQRSLPAVVCQFVWSRNVKNEATLARVGLLSQREQNQVWCGLLILSNSLCSFIRSPVLLPTQKNVVCDERNPFEVLVPWNPNLLYSKMKRTAVSVAGVWRLQGCFLCGRQCASISIYSNLKYGLSAFRCRYLNPT